MSFKGTDSPVFALEIHLLYDMKALMGSGSRPSFHWTMHARGSSCVRGCVGGESRWHWEIELRRLAYDS